MRERLAYKKDRRAAWRAYWAFIGFVALMAGLSDPAAGLIVFLAGLGIGLPILAGLFRQ